MIKKLFDIKIKKEIGYYNVPFCLICLEDLGLKEKKIMFFCGHCYHRKCFEVSVCPICKADDKISCFIL